MQNNLLFNAVLEDIMPDVKVRWLQRGYGINVGPFCLSELRFADGLLLLDKSMVENWAMLGEIVHAAALRGLEVHPDKTKNLCNKRVRTGGVATNLIDIRGLQIEVLPYQAGCKYLGRMLTLENWDRAELDHRVRCA